MSRYKAASIHLLISILVFSVFLALVYLIWYAYPLFHTEGVTSIISIMAGVDIVIGPLLTLLLFKSGKKNLIIDLSIIAAIQVSALAYGGFTVYSERPVYLVHGHDKFDVVVKAEIQGQELPEEINYVGFFDQPEFVFQPRSESPQLDETVFGLTATENGPNRLSADVMLYKDFSSSFELVINKTDLVSSSKVLKKEGIDESLQYAFVKGKTQQAIVLLDPKDASVVSYIHKSSLLME